MYSADTLILFCRTLQGKLIIMFDYSVAHWITFVLATMLLNLSPGPDMAFMLGQTIKGGRGCGFAAMLGMWLATVCHAVLAAFGLSAILLASASAFTVMKWVGALYLVWIGYQALQSRGAEFLPNDNPNESFVVSKEKAFRQEFIVCLFNPKVVLFFLAFLPQFVVPEAGPTAAQLLFHGILVVVISGIVEPPIILIADRLSHRLRDSVKFGRWLDRCLGILLIGLGFRLAMSKQ